MAVAGILPVHCDAAYSFALHLPKSQVSRDAGWTIQEVVQTLPS